MLEIPFLILYFLGPVLLPILIVVWILRRRTKKKFLEQHRRIAITEDQIARIDRDLVALKAQVHRLGLQIKPGEPAPEEPSEVEWEPTKWVSKAIEVETKEKKAPPPEPEKPAEPVTPAEPVAEPAPATEPAPRPAPIPETLPPPPPSPLDALVAKFLENWTGILGTVVLVAGIGFVGTYAAMRLTPFLRFLLVIAASGALFAGYLSLRKRQYWETMSLWFRSAAAAVFLFACAAAGGLPNAGLMWIETAGPALGMLAFGIVVNLSLSWMVRYQGFASLHVVLALIPIAILPQNTLALGIATAVSGFGVFLAHRHRWPAHLMVTLIVYLVFHIYWVSQQSVGLPLPNDLLPLAAGSAVVVFLGGALAQYSPAWRSETPDSDALLTHLAGWGLLITGVAMHLKGVSAFGGHLLGAALFVAAVVAWIMSASANRRHLDWLRTADILIAQGLLVASIFTWRSEFDEPLMFFGLVFVETLLFIRLVIKDRAALEVQIGAIVAVIAAIAYVSAGLLAISPAQTAPMAWRLAGLMVAGLAVTILAGAYFDRRFKDQFARLLGPDSLLAVGFISGFMMMVALVALLDQLAIGVVALIAGVAFISGSGPLKSLGLAWAAWIVLLAAHGITWFLCFDAYSGEPLKQLAQLAPAIALTLFSIWKTPQHSTGTSFRIVAIYLLGINLGMTAYLLLSPPSTLLPVVAWLIMSLIALEIAGRLGKVTDVVPTLHIGYAYIAAAAIGYVTVVLPTVSYLGPVNLRLAIEIFGMATLFYWWIVQAGEPLASRSHWTYVQPYFLELTLALLTTTVFVEVPLVWRPVAWMIIALLFLVPSIAALADRLAFYSLAAFYTSVLAVTVNVSTAAVPSPIWFEQPWNTGLIAIVIQAAYLFVAYRHLALQTATFPPMLFRFSRLSGKLATDLPATLCYPFFAGIALFLAWRFEQALLTFLWSAEAFVVFVLSIVFRENHFRLVALAGIAACLGRLIVYDMRETDLFIRGLVFIGVGLLMLGMNAVYNKYGRKVQLR